MTEVEITGVILDSAIEVHRRLGGPGLIERLYEDALEIELKLRGLKVERQREFDVYYKGMRLSGDLRIDILVEGIVLVECKATIVNHPIFQAQLLTYLRVTNLRVGLLINFGQRLVKEGVTRIVNG